MFRPEPKNFISMSKTSEVWSNLFWLFPAGVAVYFGNMILCLCALTAMFLSIACHVFDIKFTDKLDEIFAAFYIALGPYLLWSVKWPYLGTVISAGMTVLALSVFLYSHRVDRLYGWKAYAKVHSFWHMLSAGMALSVYITYFSALM